MTNRRDDQSFEELMAMDGVTPLDKRHKRHDPRVGSAGQKKAQKATAAAPAAGQAPAGQQGPARVPSGPSGSAAAGHKAKQPMPPAPGAVRAPQTPAPQKSAPQRPAAQAPPAAPRPAAQVPAAQAADLPVSTPAAAPADAALAAMHDELAQLGQALAAAQAQAAQATAELTGLRQELAQARSEANKLDIERRQLHEQTGRLRTELVAAREAAAQRVPLRTVLEDRGLESLDELRLVLHGLVDKRLPELLDAVHLADPEPLARLLEQRVALVHDAGGTELGSDVVVVPVSADRCEITGGSDIRSSFRRLVDACRAAQVREITIVGGSPAYRQQLKELAEPFYADLRLNLVSGTQRRTRRRAAADMRKSNLVVIWGATELDHAVSAVYTGEGAPILRVPHRGISRMLDQVAESVRSRR